MPHASALIKDSEAIAATIADLTLELIRNTRSYARCNAAYSSDHLAVTHAATTRKRTAFMLIKEYIRAGISSELATLTVQTIIDRIMEEEHL